MNTTHTRTAWGIALASATLALTTACGSEIATAPGSLGGAVEQNPPAPRSSCSSSIDYYGGCAAEGGAGTGHRTAGSGFGPQ